jgi:hypothetical protein
MADRRVVNKPKEAPVDVSTENIKIKEQPVQTIDQRLTAIETYIFSIDPYLKATINDIKTLKSRQDSLDAEITRIAGIQARANSYLDGKLAQIDDTFKSLVLIVKKLDEDYKELMSDVEYQDDSESTNAEPTEHDKE